MKTNGLSKRNIGIIVLSVMLLASVITLVACAAPTITITPSVSEGSTLYFNTEVTLQIATSDGSVPTLSVDRNDIATIQGNVLTIIAPVTQDTTITVTATHAEKEDVVASVSFVVKPVPNTATITITATRDGAELADTDRLKKGDVVTLSAVSSDGGAVSLSIDNTDLATLNGNTLTIVGDIVYNERIVVTATPVDGTGSARKTFTVEAPVVNGQKGDLSSTMIQELGNDQITANAIIKDYYTDFNNSRLDSINTYESVVKMDGSKWYGAWNALDSDIVMEYNYVMGADGVMDDNGDTGHALMQVVVNRHNQVEQKPILDYMSKYTLWENQHLYNHIAQLNIEKFIEDEWANYGTVYSYQWKTTDIEGNVYYDQADFELMCYLANSLTSVLNTGNGEYFDSFGFIIEGGKITKLVAQTPVYYDGGSLTTAEGASYMNYSTVEIVLSNVGNTTVPVPAVRSAPEHAEALQNAINSIKNATEDYAFEANDNVRYQASGDAGDYEMESTAVRSARRAASTGIYNYASSKSPLSGGGDGLYGIVSANGILLARTGSYSYTMDGNKYHTSYSGYKKIDATTYDYFEYDSSAQALKGKYQVKGDMWADVLPKWDFSVNIFEFVRTDNKGNYVFKLADASIMKEVALQTSMYTYADDAAQSTYSNFQITVTPTGEMVSVVYPYDFDTGAGVVTTVFYDGLSTQDTNDLAAAFGPTYIAREVPDAWSDYIIDDYYYLGSNLCVGENAANYGCYKEPDGDSYNYYHVGHVADGQKIVDAIFGANNDNLPTVTELHNIFGDTLGQLWYENSERERGEETYLRESIHFHWQSKVTDENSRVSDDMFEDLLYGDDSGNKGWIASFSELGFTLDPANTNWPTVKGTGKDRWLSFTCGDVDNGGVQLVIESNGTSHFWIYFYKLGEWTLK